jgi:hypothetical protein
LGRTLGEIYAEKLSIAVQYGYISEEQKIQWVRYPPKSMEEAKYRKFILKLVG